MNFKEWLNENHPEIAISMKPIDNGFFQISTQDAKMLAGGVLPKPGHEKLVQYNGKHWWLAQTIVGGKQIWAIRESNWRLNDKGQAYLGSNPGDNTAYRNAKN